MKVKHVRSGKTLALSAPQFFFAQDRSIAEEAFAGDVVGIPNRGTLRIGDALTEGEDVTFLGIPSFAPELIQSVRALDPMKAKHLERALVQLAEEGAASCFKARIGGTWLVGVVGTLQFDVLADRIRTEYGLDARFEMTSHKTARWVSSSDAAALRDFESKNQGALADDHTGALVFLSRNDWHLERTQKDFERIVFSRTKEL
jgi:peptide chain release factor 3